MLNEMKIGDLLIYSRSRSDEAIGLCLYTIQEWRDGRDTELMKVLWFDDLKVTKERLDIEYDVEYIEILSRA